MVEETPGPTPEGRLIEEAAKADRRSIRQLAANAGMSDTRWGQITRGWQRNSAGKVIPARASDEMLARMALVLELTPEDLVTVGRKDAAQELTRLLERPAVMELDVVPAISEDGKAVWVPADNVLTLRRDIHDQLTVGDHAHATVTRRADEIDLIYASKMSPREKLLRIRQVLELRVLAEAEEAGEREQAPAEEAGADEQEPQNS